MGMYSNTPCLCSDRAVRIAYIALFNAGAPNSAKFKGGGHYRGNQDLSHYLGKCPFFSISTQSELKRGFLKTIYSCYEICNLNNSQIYGTYT